MPNQINCCNLALIAFLGNIVQLVFFFNYSLKIKDKNVELSQRTKKLEQKNGHELEEIEKLKERIQELEQKLKENK